MRSLGFGTISKALWAISLPGVDCVVGIASGGIVPASLLAHQLRLPLYLLEINYRAPDNSPQREAPTLLNTIPDLPPNTRILLVDDVSVSGQTLNFARKLLAQHTIITFTLKGQADYVLFPEIKTCVNWPWNKISKSDMKKGFFNTSKHYIVAGLAGFLVCAILLYIIENLISAPNDSTLFYKQSQVSFVVLIIFIFSAISFIRGLWGALQRKFSKQE